MNADASTPTSAGKEGGGALKKRALVKRPVLHLEFSQKQLESLASGVVLSFEHGDFIVQVTADTDAVAAFKQHVYQALLAHLTPSNQSIQ